MRRRHNRTEVTETPNDAVEDSKEVQPPKPSARLISIKAQPCGTKSAVRNGSTRTSNSSSNSSSDKVWCNCKGPQKQTT